MHGWLVAPLIAVSAYAVSDTFVKTPSEEYGVVPTIALITIISALVLLAATQFVGAGTVDLAVIAYSAAIAACFSAGSVLIFNALKTEQVSNVMALTELSWVVVVLYGGLALHESVSMLQWYAVILVLLGTFFVSTTGRFRFNRAFGLVIIGQLLWGVWYIPLNYAAAESGGFIAPLLIAAAMSSIFFFGYYALERRRGPKAKRPGITPRLAAVILVVGLAYGIGLLFFGYLIEVNTVALGTAIIASEPALVILLGRLFYKDRFATHQILGFALVISGAVALGLLA